MTLQAPFPWFGGKSRVADIVWDRFGDVPIYVEPFFGSGAVLLGRPHEPRIETINDRDGYVANFWRALKNDPEKTAYYADNPVNENDLHSRHIWLINQKEDFVPKLEGDPDFYDAKIAGYWVWGVCCWIGHGFCSGKGPWHIVDNMLINTKADGKGINRNLVHLGNAGMGISRGLVHLRNIGRGINRQGVEIKNYFQALADRLRRVRVCCGDWSRICGKTPTYGIGLTAVFLDPPYSHAERCADLYATESAAAAAQCREWCLANGDNPKLRIALCGYDTEHDLPGWTKYHWRAHGGYGNQGNARGKENKSRETIWFSPYCLKRESQVNQMGFLFEGQ